MTVPSDFAPVVCVVGFHHARYSYHPGPARTALNVCRGPEIESWFGVDDGADPVADNDWSFLPFMALSDGAHTW